MKLKTMKQANYRQKTLLHINKTINTHRFVIDVHSEERKGTTFIISL